MKPDAPRTSAITDFAEWLPWVLASGPTGLRARLYGRIVSAATSVHAGVTTHTAIRCRRRPLRKACTGYLVVRRQDVPAQVQWGCPECRDRGILRGFRRTPQDLSRLAGLFEPECEVLLEEPEYRTLEGILTLQAPAERVVMAATFTPFGIRLAGRREELDTLLDDLFAAGRDPESGIPQATLDRVVVTIDRGRRHAR